MNEKTIQNIICRAGPDDAALLHIGDVFSWRNLFGAASLFLVGELSGCECWWLQSVKGPVNRAGVSIHRPMQYVYTVKELSSIYKELRVWAAADQNTISWLKSNTICWFDGT
jgi:hypothetical protein